jgi:hypothetical protein
MRFAWVVGLVVGAAAAVWPGVAAAGDAATAREQLKLGYELAQGGHCDQALPHLLESLRLDPKAITLINLADCEEKVGKLSDALGHWVDARARAESEGAKPIEDEASTRAGALEPRLARLTLTLAPTAPKDAVVSRDGVVLGAPSLGIPLPLDPGPHRIVVQAKGRADGTTELRLAVGEARRLEVDAGPEATPATGAADAGAEGQGSDGKEKKGPLTRPLVLAGGGIAILGLVVGGVTGAMALGAASTAKTDCPNLQCSQKSLDDVHSGRTLGTISTVSFVVAAVGVGLFAYGLFTPPTNRAVSVGPDGFRLRSGF